MVGSLYELLPAEAQAGWGVDGGARGGWRRGDGRGMGGQGECDVLGHHHRGAALAAARAFGSVVGRVGPRLSGHLPPPGPAPRSLGGFFPNCRKKPFAFVLWRIFYYGG